MGCCQSYSMSPEQREALAESESLDKILSSAIIEENKVVKLLLLGTGESGKLYYCNKMRLTT